MNAEFLISFPDASIAEGARLVAELKEALRQIYGIQIRDLSGGDLSVVLDAAIAVQAANALIALGSRNPFNIRRIRIKRPNGAVFESLGNELRKEDLLQQIGPDPDMAG